MKHGQACLCAMEDRESSFNRCGGPVRLLCCTSELVLNDTRVFLDYEFYSVYY